MSKHRGSNFDDFLKEEGMFEKAESEAKKRISKEYFLYMTGKLTVKLEDEEELMTGLKKNYRSCPPSKHKDIHKENAWLVWIINDDGKVIDLEVYERNPNKTEESIETYQYIQNRLKGDYLDIGSISGSWKNWTFKDVIDNIFNYYGMSDIYVTIKCFRSLLRIIEFRDDWLKLFSIIENPS